MKSQISWDPQLLLFECDGSWGSLSAELQQQLLSALSDLLAAHLDYEDLRVEEEQEDESKD